MHLDLNGKKPKQSDKEIFLSTIEETRSSISSTNNNNMNREYWAYFLAVACHFIWALGVIVMKIASYSVKFSPNNFSMWRSVFMSIVTYIYVKFYNKSKMNNFFEMKIKIWFLVRIFGIYFTFLFFLKFFTLFACSYFILHFISKSINCNFFIYFFIKRKILLEIFNRSNYMFYRFSNDFIK